MKLKAFLWDMVYNVLILLMFLMAGDRVGGYWMALAPPWHTFQHFMALDANLMRLVIGVSVGMGAAGTIFIYQTVLALVDLFSPETSRAPSPETVTGPGNTTLGEGVILSRHH